jgi:putative ABC transport system permease protein
MLSDFRNSVRLLRQAPGLALAAVSILALAIGANAAAFSVIDKVLLASPIERPDRIAVIWSRSRAEGSSIGEFSYPTFRAWQTSATGFQHLAAIGSTNWSVILRESDSPATIPVAAVSASFFPLMGAAPMLGRTLLPEDDRPGSANVAVVSHASWIRRFGSDRDIVGRPLRFEDALDTIVGVMPPGFDYPRGAELWLPLAPQLVAHGRMERIGIPTY